MKPKLVLATRNEGKISEMRLALAEMDVDLLSARELGLGEGPEEHGSSYEENALIKAAHAAHASGLPALADDSGLEVDALDGAPGIHSARFGGELGYGERIAYLLQRLKHLPPEDRGASFVSVLVLATADGRIKTFTGRCSGRLLLGPRGEGGHGYDPIFWSPELGKSFAEATESEKGRVSHRGLAIAQLLDWSRGHESWLTTGPQLNGAGDRSD
ncbi:MAG: RdgB/HAM1 family non-canonical purine NTP pyrophosphatase [Trueperaceae bacterium]